MSVVGLARAWARSLRRYLPGGRVRVAIAGAGAVGRAIAQRLVDSGHKVLLIERHRPHFAPHLVPGANWMFADACELDKLRAAGIETCDVVVATAGDDKVNLVFALLSKTEFAVARVVARVNNPDNRWLFTESWGVDVAVDTPSRLVAVVEEAVAVGDVVPLMTLAGGAQDIVEVRLTSESALIGRKASELGLPDGIRVVSIVRDSMLFQPSDDVAFAPDDEVVLVVDTLVPYDVRAILTT
jgi:trk system potassium uptake protein TrkA